MAATWSKPHPLRSRNHRGGAPRDRAGFPDHPAPFTQWKAAGLREPGSQTTPEELARFLKRRYRPPARISSIARNVASGSRNSRAPNLTSPAGPRSSPANPPSPSAASRLSGDFIGSLHGESSRGAGIDDLLDRLERDEFDAGRGIGRALLVDPAWTRKVQEEARYDELLRWLRAPRRSRPCPDSTGALSRGESVVHGSQANRSNVHRYPVWDQADPDIRFGRPSSDMRLSARTATGHLGGPTHCFDRLIASLGSRRVSRNLRTCITSSLCGSPVAFRPTSPSPSSAPKR